MVKSEVRSLVMLIVGVGLITVSILFNQFVSKPLSIESDELMVDIYNSMYKVGYEHGVAKGDMWSFKEDSIRVDSIVRNVLLEGK